MVSGGIWPGLLGVIGLGFGSRGFLIEALGLRFWVFSFCVVKGRVVSIVVLVPVGRWGVFLRVLEVEDSGGIGRAAGVCWGRARLAEPRSNGNHSWDE